MGGSRARTLTISAVSGAAAAALAIIATATLGRSLQPVIFIAAIVWLLGVMLALWLFWLLPGKKPVFTLLAGASIALLIGGLGGHLGKTLFHYHWLVQLGLVLALAVAWRTGTAGAEPADADSRLLDDVARDYTAVDRQLGRLAESDWLKSFETGSAGARLRAALLWWREDLQSGFAELGPRAARPVVATYLADSRRQLDLVAQLGREEERRYELLVDAERRVLTAIEQLAQLRP